ncbi:MAG: hypothetical protein WCA49_01765 [Candidatus Sulfotelmatobacter sp.]
MNNLVQAPGPWQVRRNHGFVGTAFTILAPVMRASVAIARLQGTAAYGAHRIQSARRWLVSNLAHLDPQPYQAVKP